MPEPAVAGELDEVTLRRERLAALMTRPKVVAPNPGPPVPLRMLRVMAAVLAAAALAMEAVSLVLHGPEQRDDGSLASRLQRHFDRDRRPDLPDRRMAARLAAAREPDRMALPRHQRGAHSDAGRGPIRVLRTRRSARRCPADGRGVMARRLDVGPGVRARVRPGPPVPGWIAPVATLATGPLAGCRRGRPDGRSRCRRRPEHQRPRHRAGRARGHEPAAVYASTTSDRRSARC